MSNNENNTNKIMQLIFWAMIGGQLLFLSVVYFFRASGMIEFSNPLIEQYRHFAGAAALLIFLSSNFIYKGQIKKIDPSNANKNEKIKAISIQRFALAELGCMILITGYLLTGSYFFLILYLILLFMFLKMKPV